MTKNMKKFLETVSQHEELAKKLCAMPMEDLLALAKELGVELTEADFEKPDGMLDENELDAVAGGKVCVCVVGAGGEGDGNDRVCACPAYGVGADKDKLYDRCVCFIGGGGKSYN